MESVSKGGGILLLVAEMVMHRNGDLPKSDVGSVVIL